MEIVRQSRLFDNLHLSNLTNLTYLARVWSVLGGCKEFIGPAEEHRGDQGKALLFINCCFLFII